MIRRILVDHARKQEVGKRGELLEVPLEEALLVEALDAALTALSRVDARKCRVVELRFFGGLSVAETATGESRRRGFIPN